MRIPEETIEAIRAAIDIVEVVGEYVPLRRRGANWFGLCPFHEEKTPSFSVNPHLGIFKCFGCGRGGDVFAFIQQIEHVSFVEAVRMLAERAGIPLPDGEEEADDPRPALYHALRFAARFYFEQLTQSEAGQVARAYLKQRGIHPEAVRRFGLGYAPNAWDALLKAATEAGIRSEVLEQAGLVLPRKERGGYYDRFRHRLMFPIFSHTGRVVGFGGRLLEPDPEQPKYINTPETPVYHKGRILYGLYQARQALRTQEEAILVEGYTDVIALHQAGIEHVVATSGTALTPDQARLLARYVRRVVLLFDADAAGQQAALRSIELFLERGDVIARERALHRVDVVEGNLDERLGLVGEEDLGEAVVAGGHRKPGMAVVALDDRDDLASFCGVSGRFYGNVHSLGAAWGEDGVGQHKHPCLERTEGDLHRLRMNGDAFLVELFFRLDGHTSGSCAFIIEC